MFRKNGPSHKSRLLIHSSWWQRNSSSFGSHGWVWLAKKEKIEDFLWFRKLTRTKGSKNYFKSKTTDISTISTRKIIIRKHWFMIFSSPKMSSNHARRRNNTKIVCFINLSTFHWILIEENKPSKRSFLKHTILSFGIIYADW
jgi:hypothetical protein